MSRMLARYLLFAAPAVLAVIVVLRLSGNTHSTPKSKVERAKPSVLKAEAQIRDSGDENRSPAFVGQSSAKTARAIHLARGDGSDDTLLCDSVEYPGRGPASIDHFEEPDWQKVIRDFHLSKDRLLSWVKSHGSIFSSPMVERMMTQIENLKIYRPQAGGEPDLAWRGIGVLSRDADGLLQIKIGSGFEQLIRHNPERAQFEMTRLVAQTWAPCYLQAAGVGQPWATVLQCLGVKEEGACSKGSVSEGGWAVSSAIAAIVASPGCTLPAFQGVDPASCFEPATASRGKRIYEIFKEARQ